MSSRTELQAGERIDGDGISRYLADVAVDLTAAVGVEQRAHACVEPGEIAPFEGTAYGRGDPWTALAGHRCVRRHAQLEFIGPRPMISRPDVV